MTTKNPTLLITFFLLLFSTTTIFSQEGEWPQDSTETTDSPKDLKRLEQDIEQNLDGLEQELENMESSLREMEEKKRAAVPAVTETEIENEEEEEERENLEEDIDDLREELAETRSELKEEIEDAEEEIQEQIEEMQEEKRNRGGAFMFSTRILWQDTDPLKKLNRTDTELMGKVFDFDDRKTLMLGLNGYYDIENGLRVGNNLAVGYKLYQSDVYKGMHIDTIMGDTTYVDSLVNLRVIPAHFGFLCEKAFLFPNFSLFAGFMIGGGATVLIKNNEASSANSAFINDTNNNNGDGYSVAVAPTFNWDFHFGTSVTLAPHFHLGLDYVLHFAYAHDGYGMSRDDFVSVSPGIRLRITIGKEG